MTLQEFFDITPYQWQSIIAAIICGGMIGCERQVRGKPVGIRTAALITLGTYLFMATTASLEPGTYDPSRVMGQIITGIGFLGAGVMLARDGAVVGVTSAATIWVLAAIGVLIGTDNLIAGYKMSLLVVGILYGVDILEKHVKSLTRGVHTSIRNLHRRDEIRGGIIEAFVDEIQVKMEEKEEEKQEEMREEKQEEMEQGRADPDSSEKRP